MEIYRPDHQADTLRDISGNEQPMSRDEMLNFFLGCQDDPNFNMLIFPRFVVEGAPEVFGDRPVSVIEERYKRIDYIDALLEAKDDKEREMICGIRREQLKNQVVAHLSLIHI